MLTTRARRGLILLILALLVFLLVAIPMMTQFSDPNNLLQLVATFENGFGGTSQPAGTPWGTPYVTPTPSA